jgi:hypothetical protein
LFTDLDTPSYYNNFGKKKEKEKSRKKERKIKKDCFFAPGHELVKAEPIKILP